MLEKEENYAELLDFNELEKLEIELLEEYNNYFFDDSLSSYLKTIGNYPLLTIEEEKNIGKDLKLINDCSISKIIDDTTNILDICKLFKGLIGKANYEDIITSLKKMYIDYYPNNNNLNILSKYYKNCKLVGRTLNEEELYNIVNVNVKDIDFKIDYKELLKGTNNFIKYSIAKEKMVKSNLKLVVAIAKRYKNISNCDFLEIINEGNIGLLKAIDRFDVDKGFKFSTFAVWWIRQSITSYVYANKSNLSVSRRFVELVNKFNKDLKELKNRTGKQYTIDELSKIFGIDSTTIVEDLNFNDNVVSLDQPVGEDEDNTILDFVEDTSCDIEDASTLLALRSDVASLLKILNEREQKVLLLRFGIGCEVHSLEEIGKLFNITRERVRQIENKALTKMRKKTIYNKGAKSLELYLK